jgi:histidinol-phosphate aminotransferase
MKRPSELLSSSELVRPLVRELSGYVPGEQPKVKGLVKLNTNENPYPPSPKVLQAICCAADQRLRLYPNPTAEKLRERLARLHGCGPENIIVGNGSDELLALATRAFVEPLPGLNAGNVKPATGSVLSRCTVQYLEPSYSLYPVLAEIHGAHCKPVQLKENYGLPAPAELRAAKWDFRAALTFVTTPNAPGGRGYTRLELEQLCRLQRGVTVLDEAYVDFAAEHALDLALRLPNVIVSRTFSKAYSLCFLRVGYFVSSPELISALNKIRDSYNVNGLAQIAAEAALASLPYYRKNFRLIIEERELLAQRLRALGFEVQPSQTNFLLVRPPRFSAEEWLGKLRGRKILVRWFSQRAVRDWLRITIGSRGEMQKLIAATRDILA